MGCVCLRKNTDGKNETSEIITKSEEKENQLIYPNEKESDKLNSDDENSVITKNLRLNTIDELDFTEKMINLINQARSNPQEYSNLIKNSMKYLVEKDILVFEPDGKKYKVENSFVVFEEAVKDLESISPVSTVIKSDLLIKSSLKFLEDNEKKLANKFRKKETEVKNNHYQIFIKGHQNHRFLFILMCLDKKNRDILFTKNFNYVGISAKYYKNNILCSIEFMI